MLEIEEAFNILEEEYKKQKTLLNKIHTIKEYLFDLEADLEEEKAENYEKAEIIDKAIKCIEKLDENKLEIGDNLLILDYYLSDLLDILRGEDNENIRTN